jgi:hypothetical protein
MQSRTGWSLVLVFIGGAIATQVPWAKVLYPDKDGRFLALQQHQHVQGDPDPALTRDTPEGVKLCITAIGLAGSSDKAQRGTGVMMTMSLCPVDKFCQAMRTAAMTGDQDFVSHLQPMFHDWCE